MIYILSKYPYLDIGHYWSFDGYLRAALADNQLEFYFLNEDAQRAKSEDYNKFSRPHNKYIEIRNDDSFMKNCVDFIISMVAESKLKKIVILIPWVPQFSEKELEELNQLEKIAEVAFVGLTVLSPASLQGRTIIGKRYLHEGYFSQKENSLLWVSDTVPLNYPNKFIRAMPDYAESSIKKSAITSFDLSFFGLLTPYRGLFEILVIAFFNPRLKIRIKGYGFSPYRVLRPWKQKKYRYQTWKDKPFLCGPLVATSVLLSLARFLPNVDFSPIPFSSEGELDQAMGETRAIFYCPKLPHGSGLTNKALANDIPIIWNGWEGRAFNLLSKYYCAGYFKYFEIFLPGRIGRKLENLPSNINIKDLMLQNFVKEVGIIESFI